MYGAIISGAMSLASSIYGGMQASSAANQASKLLEQQKKDNEAWYRRRYNEDYSQTAEAQHMLNYARKQAEQLWRRADGAAAIGGGTDEAVAQAKAAGNEMIADTASNIAAQGTARKDQIEQQYHNTANNLTQQQMASLNQKAQNISQAAGGASSSFGQFGSALLSQKFGK